MCAAYVHTVGRCGASKNKPFFVTVATKQQALGQINRIAVYIFTATALPATPLPKHRWVDLT